MIILFLIVYGFSIKFLIFKLDKYIKSHLFIFINNNYLLESGKM
jgi:hypothetical protein